jgi:NAD(P)H-flavin reductase
VKSPMESFVAHVMERRDVGGGMTLFALEVPGALRESYLRPGQYAHLTLIGEAGYFVLGSREKRAPWEIVLRRGGGVADLLLAAPVGLEIAASRAIGTGFPVDAARGTETVVLVTAGAIAAARAVVGRRIDDGDAARTSLLIGARSLSTVPFEDELAAMRTSGVKVRIVLSAAEGSAAAPHDRGYVQNILAREWASDAWVFVAGASEMVQGVKAMARRLGAPDDRIVSNID